MDASSSAPPDAVSTTTAKSPPPESPESIGLRTKIVLSFWAVILFLGLPTWWQTTSIYRADLPLQDMLNWADGSNTPTALPLHIWVMASDFPCSDAQRLVQETQHALDDLNEYPTMHQRLHLVNALSTSGGRAGQTDAGSCGVDPLSLDLGDPALKMVLRPSSDGGVTFEVDAVGAVATLRASPGSASSAVAKDLAGTLHRLFQHEQIAAALQTVHLSGNSNNAQAFLKSQPYDRVTGVERQINRAYKSSPEFHLTFSLFTAGGAPSGWDIQEALDEHIEPLVRALSNTAHFDITTQVQLYSSYSPAVQPAVLDGQDGRFLRQEDLTAFVNAAEWPLAPSIGDGPTLNFILYVPASHEIPLRIEGTQGTSWLIPQWGGVQVLNPPLHSNSTSGLPAHLDKDTLREPFTTFSSQLLSLLGVSQVEDAAPKIPLQLRLDAYKRLSALTLYLKAASSLGSLSRLAQRLNNIPIPRNVAQLVDDTIGNLTQASNDFLESRWDSALAEATTAYRDSEKAFFDKSMVGQVYFPDEHKVAVYLPLLGPIGVPLIVGLVKEIKRFAARRKTATQ